MNNDLQKSIQKVMNKKDQTPASDTVDREKEQALPEQASFSENDRMDSQKKRDKPLKVFGWLCIALFVLALIFDPVSSVNTSDAAKNALVDKISTSLPAGTVLLANDENIGQQDYTIVHNYAQKDTKIWVWDYAAEDGDYVQVLVNGAPVGDPFMIKHKPVEITVPAVGDVQIKGIRDGGGGITYAVRYDLNGTTYFNSAPEGEFNTYTLIKE